MVPLNIRMFLKTLRDSQLGVYETMSNHKTAAANANDYMHMKIKRSDTKKRVPVFQ